MTVELQADCSRCVGLCCVAPAFGASADFALTKPAGSPCPNLQADFRCGVHTQLRPLGFPGCVVYDCFGAGQRVTAAFAGQDWRTPEVAAPMFAAFERTRVLHELLWYLNEAPPTPELQALSTLTEDFTGDLDAHRGEVNALLLKASALARAGLDGADHRGANLVGQDLKPVRLIGASLRGAALVGADLQGVDLAFADVTGADFRGADLRGADLSRTLFLLHSQLESAVGDSTTTLPVGRTRPQHWQ